MTDEAKAEDLAALFQRSREEAEKVARCERELAEHRAARMAIAKQIFDAHGKGPFELGGESYVIAVRPGKDITGYFLQRKSLPKPKPSPAV